MLFFFYRTLKRPKLTRMRKILSQTHQDLCCRRNLRSIWKTKAATTGRLSGSLESLPCSVTTGRELRVREILASGPALDGFCTRRREDVLLFVPSGDRVSACSKPESFLKLRHRLAADIEGNGVLVGDPDLILGAYIIQYMGLVQTIRN